MDLSELNQINDEFKSRVKEANKPYIFYNFKYKPNYNYVQVKSYDDIDVNRFKKHKCDLFDFTNINNILKFIKIAMIDFHNDLFDDDDWVCIKNIKKNKNLLDNLELIDLNNDDGGDNNNDNNNDDNNIYLINSISCDKITDNLLIRFKDIMYDRFKNIEVNLYEYDNSNNGCNFYWVVIKLNYKNDKN
jgi:hypothetical protein